MFVQGDQLAEHRRRQPLGEDHRARTIALEVAVRLVDVRPPERHRLGLGDQVGDQQVVVLLVRMVRLGEADEVDRHDPGALVEQLVERVLAVRARLTPHDRPGVVVDP